MVKPPSASAVWSDLIMGKRSLEFEFLAAKISLVHLRLSIGRDKTPANVERCANELYELFASNAELPCVKRDLWKLGVEE